MKISILQLFIFIVFSINTLFSQSWKTYPYTPTGSLISFPKDEGRHTAESTEWWYTSGHLVGQTTGKKYSYMLTYFYNPRFIYDGFRILNISDDSAQQFNTNTKLVNYNILATDSLNIEASVTGGIETWLNKTDANGNMIPFEYLLSASSSSSALNLEYKALKKPLIIDGDGFFDQGVSSYTYYYSQTRNEVIGTITLNGMTEQVIGTSWIDRQYGNFNSNSDEQYEWFNIQLSNGMDLILWNIFTDSNTVPNQLEYKVLAGYVDENTQFTTKDFQLERLAYDCVPSGGLCYAQKWKLTSAINNIDLLITTQNIDSEVQLPFKFYEGATTITGTVNNISVTGVGFAELLQPYEDPDLTLINPNDGNWTTTEPIEWQLNNPNEGRPITYDLQYSIDDKNTFTSIVQGITENSYLWNNPPLANNDNIWFKLKGYSIDNTLKSEIVSSSSSTVTLSVDDGFEKNSINIYPIPASNLLHVKSNQNFDELNYQIIDISGRILERKNLKNSNAFEIDIKNLEPGVYFFKLQKDHKRLVSKFIVQ